VSTKEGKIDVIAVTPGVTSGEVAVSIRQAETLRTLLLLRFKGR
jgi:hypothetical protein